MYLYILRTDYRVGPKPPVACRENEGTNSSGLSWPQLVSLLCVNVLVVLHPALKFEVKILRLRPPVVTYVPYLGDTWEGVF